MWFPTGQALGQSLLRWKIKEGDRLIVEMTQETKSQVGFSSKSATTKIDLAMRLSWEVVKADENAISVKQTIEQVRASLVSEGGNAEFDSASKTRATGLAKQLADSLQSLVGAEIEVVFTPRGEVTSATAVNESAQALLAAEDTPGDAAAAPRSSLAQLVSQSIVQLPEKKVALGDKWTASRSIQSAAGPLRHGTTYVLEAINNGECTISTSAQLESAGEEAKKPAAAMRIKSHEQTGSVEFSLENGRPREVKQTQELKTERPYRDTTIEVTLTSSVKMTFADASAKN